MKTNCFSPKGVIDAMFGDKTAPIFSCFGEKEQKLRKTLLG